MGLNNLGQWKWEQIRKIVGCSTNTFRYMQPKHINNSIDDAQLETFLRNLSNTERGKIREFSKQAISEPILSRKLGLSYKQPPFKQPPFKKSLIAGMRRQQKKYFG